MKIEFVMDAQALEGTIFRTLERVRAAALAAGSVAIEECAAATELTRNYIPVATGQSRGMVHVIAEREGGTTRAGVGIGRTTNQQAIRAERSEFEPHTHAHDLKGKKCSTGNAGGWAADEPENVRESYDRVEVNPSASMQPLGRAVTERLGGVINLNAAQRFSKGDRNVYPANVYPRSIALLNETPIGRKLQAAAREILVR